MAKAIFILSPILCYAGITHRTIFSTTEDHDRWCKLFLNDIEVSNNHQFRYDENNLSFFTPAFTIRRLQRSFMSINWMVTVTIECYKGQSAEFSAVTTWYLYIQGEASINNIFTSAPEASFTFTILKPFWQTAWFIILSIVLLTSAIYFLIKEREKHFTKLGSLEKKK